MGAARPREGAAAAYTPPHTPPGPGAVALPRLWGKASKLEISPSRPRRDQSGRNSFFPGWGKKKNKSISRGREECFQPSFSLAIKVRD